MYVSRNISRTNVIIRENLSLDQEGWSVRPTLGASVVCRRLYLVSK